MSTIKLFLVLTSLAFAAAALPAAVTDHSASKQASLPAAITTDLKAAIQSYVAVSSALAADNLQEAKRAAQSVPSRTQGVGARTSTTGEFDKHLQRVSASAKKIAAATDLREARSEFRQMSEGIIAIVKSQPQLKGDLSIYRCPMAKGFNQWMQTADSPRNPYFGKKMVSCGLKSGG
jgi:hypothetical protein